MFLQTKYQNQFQQDTRTTFNGTFGGTLGFQQFKREPKHKAAVAGSVKLGRMDFERSEQIFSREDMPHKSLTCKNQMTQLVDPDILGLRKKEWDNSNAVPLNTQEEDFDRKQTKIRMGFFDSPNHKYTPPKIEVGTDIRDNYKGWNVSTELPNQFQKQRSLDEQTQNSMGMTRGHFGTLRDYKSPEEITKAYNETLRQTKRDEKELKAELRTQYKFENPSATEEKVNAGVNRLVYELKIRSLSPKLEDPFHNETFKHDLSRTTKHTVSHYAYHNGSWGKNNVSSDKEVWSCCMMEKKTGEGCVKVRVNPNRWLFNPAGTGAC